VGGASSGFGYNVADLVALATDGVAVKAKRPDTGCYYCSGLDAVDGNVITGGGSVSGLEFLFDSPPYPVDTSGTNPRVADCEHAMDTIRDASARLAALTPTQVFGDVSIGLGEKMTIDARGGAVIRMDSLRMASSPQKIYDYDPVVRFCESGDESQIAHLEVLMNDGDQVVINVPTLALGSCAQPTWRTA